MPYTFLSHLSTKLENICELIVEFCLAEGKTFQNLNV